MVVVREIVVRLVLVPFILVLGACGEVSIGDAPLARSMCFDYYQRCVDPVFSTSITFNASTTSCTGSSSCHINPAGSGESFKINVGAPLVPAASFSSMASLGAPMYGNFVSTKGNADIGDLLTKPVDVGGTHGGGQVMDTTYPEFKQLEYWTNNRVDDPFASCSALFNGVAPGGYSTDVTQCQSF